MPPPIEETAGAGQNVNIQQRLASLEQDKQVAQYVLRGGRMKFLAGTWDFGSGDGFVLNLGKSYTIRYRIRSCDPSVAEFRIEWRKSILGRPIEFSSVNSSANGEASHEFIFSPLKRSDCQIKWASNPSHLACCSESSFIIIQQIV